VLPDAAVVCAGADGVVVAPPPAAGVVVGAVPAVVTGGIETETPSELQRATAAFEACA